MSVSYAINSHSQALGSSSMASHFVVEHISFFIFLSYHHALGVLIIQASSFSSIIFPALCSVRKYRAEILESIARHQRYAMSIIVPITPFNNENKCSNAVQAP
jgi:hypothetical protein